MLPVLGVRAADRWLYERATTRTGGSADGRRGGPAACARWGLVSADPSLGEMGTGERFDFEDSEVGTFVMSMTGGATI